MKITRLNKAKGYRIFRDFVWPASDLQDFGRFNVIYGWNGSGKTSLSNVFRHLQRRAPLLEGQVELLVDQTRVAGTDFGTALLPDVRTFNRDTVDRNVFEAVNQQFPPVFFLGEDSVEKQKRIEELKVELAAHANAELRHAQTKANASAALDSLCAEEAKGIKNLLTVAGGGPYNNFNAGNFKASLQGLAASATAPTGLSALARKKYLAMKDAKPMEVVEAPSISFPDVGDLTARTKAALERSVVSSVIAELAERPDIASWVSAGLSLHTDGHGSGAGSCLFCDQALPEHRMRRLEAHFNDEFKRFQADVDGLIREIESAKEFAKALRAPPKEALYADLRSDYETAASKLQVQSATVKTSLDVLLRALKAKRDEPFARLELMHFITNATAEGEPASGIETFFQVVLTGAAMLSAALGKAAFETMKQVIEQHNAHTASFDAELSAARTALARDELIKALPAWQKKLAAVKDADGQSTAARDSAARVKREISELEVQVRQHRRPAEELNQEVASYLGRDELKFDVEQNGYKILRGGQPASHLSDGERTALAFLYFLKSLKGTDFDLEKGVVVVDDPVSSLDANSLFSAFGFMKQRTSAAGQLFVLTHNFTFFRQVRNWYSNLPGQRKGDLNIRPARFYMLASEFVDGERTAKLSALDPFLHRYESEYHYLFKRVHDEAHKATAVGLEAYYAIPNIARRLLEAFLAFRIPDKPGELFLKLESVDFDQAKKTRILRFLHTFSHFDQVADPEHDPSMLSETPAILKDVLALIDHCDPEHFKSMAGLVASES